MIYRRPWKTQPPFGTTVRAPGLVASYPFSDTSPTLLRDASGALHGAVSGTLTRRATPLGMAGVFNGSTYIDLGGTDAFKPIALTFSIWANFSALANAYTAVISYIGGAEYYQLFVKSSGKLALYANTNSGGDGAYDGSGVATLTTDKWYHLAITWDSVDGRFTAYVNGVVDGTFALAATTYSPNASSVTIGTDLGSAGRLLNGLLINACFLSRRMTADQIVRLYNDPWRQFTPPPARLWVSAAVGGAVFNPMSGRGGASAQPLAVH